MNKQFVQYRANKKKELMEEHGMVGKTWDDLALETIEVKDKQANLYINAMYETVSKLIL